MTSNERIDSLDDVHFPEEVRDMFGFNCPDCGKQIRPPYGGHTWTCHEAYGGCGAKFTPVEAFRRVDDDHDTD